MTRRNEKERFESVWRSKLHQAEEAYAVAFAQVREIQEEMESLPASDGIIALEKSSEAPKSSVG
jgi:hypothetical protein